MVILLWHVGWLPILKIIVPNPLLEGERQALEWVAHAYAH